MSRPSQAEQAAHLVAHTHAALIILMAVMLMAPIYLVCLDRNRRAQYDYRDDPRVTKGLLVGLGFIGVAVVVLFS